MPNQAELRAVVTAEDAQFQAVLKNAQRQFEQFGRTLSSIGQQMSFAITAPIVLLGREAFNTAVRFDSLTRGFTAIMGSAKLAREEMERLIPVAKLPGIGLEEAYQGSLRLQAAGLSADRARDSLIGFGNALATVGRGKEDLDPVILALTEIEAQGKVNMQQIRMLQLRVPQIRQVMKEAFGTAKPEIFQKAKLGADEFIDRLVAQLNRLPKFTSGIKNDINNLQDQWKFALLAMGNAMKPFAAEIITKLANSIKQLTDYINNMTPAQKKMAIEAIASVAAIGPLLLIVGQLSFAVLNIGKLFMGFGTVVRSIGALFAEAGGAVGILTSAFEVLTGPVGWVIAAATAIYLAWRNNFAGIRDVVGQIWDEIVQTFNGITGDVQKWVADNREIIDAYIAAIKFEWSIFWSMLTTVVSWALNVIKDLISVVLSTVRTIIRINLDLLSGNWKDIWDALVEWTDNLLTNFQLIVLRTFNGLLKLVRDFSNLFAKILGMSFTGLDDSIKLYDDRIKDLDESLHKHVKVVNEVAKAHKNVLDVPLIKPKGNMPAINLEDRVPGKKGKESEGEKQTKSLREALLDMRREIDLGTTATKTQGMVWDITNGKYRLATASVKALAVAVAGQLDKVTAARSAHEAYKDALEGVYASTRKARTESELNNLVIDLQTKMHRALSAAEMKTLSAAVAVREAEKTSRDEMKKKAAAIKEATDNMKTQIEAAQEEVATARMQTSAEKTLWEIQNNRFKGVSMWMQMILLGYRQQADAVKKQIETETAIADAQKKFTDAMTDTRLKMAELTATSDLQRATISRVRDGFAGYAAILLAVKDLEVERAEAVKKTNEAFTKEVQNLRQQREEILETSKHARSLQDYLAKGFTLLQAQILLTMNTMNEELAKRQAQIKKVADQITDVFMRAIEKIEHQGFKNLWANVLDGLNKMLLDMANDIIKSQMHKLIAGLVKNAMGSGGGLPGFAAGGVIPSGQPSIVGENGPELIVPSVSTAVIPNHQLNKLGGNKTIIVNQTVNAPNPGGFKRSGRAQLRALGHALARG